MRRKLGSQGCKSFYLFLHKILAALSLQLFLDFVWFPVTSFYEVWYLYTASLHMSTALEFKNLSDCAEIHRGPTHFLMKTKLRHHWTIDVEVPVWIALQWNESFFGYCRCPNCWSHVEFLNFECRDLRCCGWIKLLSLCGAFLTFSSPFSPPW